MPRGRAPAKVVERTLTGAAERGATAEAAVASETATASEATAATEATAAVESNAASEAVLASETAGVTNPATGVMAMTELAVMTGAIAGFAATTLNTILYSWKTNSIIHYGTPYGAPAEDIAFPLLRTARQYPPPILPIPPSASRPTSKAKPVPQAVPRPVPAPETPADKNRRRRHPYAIRAQIQQGRTNISSATYVSDRPITGLQALMTFLQAYADMPAGYATYDPGISAAIDRMRLWIYQTSVGGGGISSVGNVHREWVTLNPRPSPNIRIDFENEAGINLRTLW